MNSLPAPITNSPRSRKPSASTPCAYMIHAANSRGQDINKEGSCVLLHEPSFNLDLLAIYSYSLIFFTTPSYYKKEKRVRL